MARANLALTKKDIERIKAEGKADAEKKLSLEIIDNARQGVDVFFETIADFFDAHWTPRKIVEWLAKKGVDVPKKGGGRQAMSIATLDQYYTEARKRREAAIAAGLDPDVLPLPKSRRGLTKAVRAAPKPSKVPATKAAPVVKKPVLAVVETAPVARPVEVAVTADEAEVKPVLADADDVVPVPDASRITANRARPRSDF